MEQVFKIFEELMGTTKKSEKAAILIRNQENRLFTSTLKWLLDPFIVTGISSKKLSKNVSYDTTPIQTWGDMMVYFENHHTGSDDDIKIVQGFIESQPEEQREYYRALVIKSLKLGVDAKSVNDVIPNLIPTFSVQLGIPREKCKIKSGDWFSLSQKLNGNRCVFVNGKMMSRQGKEFTGLDHILSDIQKVVDNGIVLDGELVGKNEEGLSDSANFQKSTGIANSKDADKTSLKYVIFDTLRLEEFQNGKSEYTYKIRRQLLLELKETIAKHNLKNIEVVQMFYEGTDQTEIDKWLDYCEEHDYEGCMINLDSPYECKRVKSLQKAKMFKDIDLRCISVNEAITGKYKGTLGSITCKYKNGTVDVGSGFSDEQRGYYFNNPNEIVGKIITVKYKETTTNKKGGESLQFPVFVTVRFDKDVADD